MNHGLGALLINLLLWYFVITMMIFGFCYLMQRPDLAHGVARIAFLRIPGRIIQGIGELLIQIITFVFRLNRNNNNRRSGGGGGGHHH